MNPKATYLLFGNATFELVEIVRNSQKALVYREQTADNVPLAFRRTVKVFLPKNSKNGTTRVTLEVTTPVYGPNKDGVNVLQGSLKSICTHFYAANSSVEQKGTHLRFFNSANWVIKDDTAVSDDNTPVGNYAPVFTGKANIVV